MSLNAQGILILNLEIMLRNILGLEGVKVLTKQEQSNVLGSRLTNCTRQVIENQTYVECWDTDREDYRMFTILGEEVECPYD